MYGDYDGFQHSNHSLSVPGTDSGCINAVAVDPWTDAEVVMKDGICKPIDLVGTGTPTKDVYCDTLW